MDIDEWAHFPGLRVRFTVGYVAVLLVVSFAILALGPHARDVIIQRASTNLHNLARHIGRCWVARSSSMLVRSISGCPS